MKYLVFTLLLITTSYSSILYAQFNYYDVNPDFLIDIHNTPGQYVQNDTNEYSLDIDNDSYNDVKIMSINKEWAKVYFKIVPLHANLLIADSTGNAYVFNDGDVIKDHLYTWNNDTADLFSFVSGNHLGSWLNMSDKFIGIQKINGNDTLYGWIRISTQIFPPINYLSDFLIIHDYCIESIPNTNFFAGSGLNYDAKNVTATDEGNNKNGNDLRIKFTKAYHESFLTEYRTIVVPVSALPSFGLNEAILTASGNYSSIVPTGSDTYSFVFGNTNNDFNGNPITDLVPYKVFVLSVPDGINATDYVLSDPSERIMLTVKPLPVTNVHAIDLYDNNNSNDINLCMNYPAGFSGITGFRVFIVKSLDTSSFNIDSALSVLPQNYYYYNTSSALSCMVIPQGINDIDGDPVVNSVKYNIFVLSMPDMSSTDYPAISEYSNIIELNSPGFFYAGQTSGTGAGFYDIVPDSLLEMPSCYYCIVNNHYEIDADTNGIADFTIEAGCISGSSHAYLQYCVCNCNNGNYFISDLPGSIYAKPLEEFEQFSYTQNWSSGEAILYRNNFTPSPTSSYKDGIWPQGVPKYLGLRMLHFNDTIDLWVQILFNPAKNSSFLISSYGWNNNNSLVKPSITHKRILIYPNPANDCLTIIIDDERKIDYTISDMTGKTFITGTTDGNSPVNISRLNKGLFFLNISSGNSTTHYKFIKE